MLDPGYGASPGIPSERSADESTRAAYAYAKSKNFERILLGGRSVGTGPICRLARKVCLESSPEFAGIILWSPIVSVKESCANLAGATISSLLGERWAPIKDLPFVSRPILFISGERDSLTTPFMCNRLRIASTQSSYTFLHTSETADHNQNWDFAIDVAQPMSRFIEFVSKQSTFALDEDETLEGQTESDRALNGDHVLGGNLGEYAIAAKKEDEAKTKATGPVTPYDKVDVVIVGCGPVGLWVACSLLHLGMRGEKILCVDKYATFQRSHVLRLEAQSVAGAPESLQELVSDQLGVTRTNAIEAKLAEECKKKGVHFMRPFDVKDPRAFVKSFAPACRAVICCDGSHSVSRKQLFGGLDRRYTLEYVLDCRGEVFSQDKPGKLPFATIVDMLGKTVSLYIKEKTYFSEMQTSTDKDENSRLMLVKNLWVEKPGLERRWVKSHPFNI
jgi:hypothetical protein